MTLINIYAHIYLKSVNRNKGRQMYLHKNNWSLDTLFLLMDNLDKNFNNKNANLHN